MPRTMKEYRRRYIKQAINNNKRLDHRLDIIEYSTANMSLDLEKLLQNAQQASKELRNSLEAIKRYLG